MGKSHLDHPFNQTTKYSSESIPSLPSPKRGGKLKAVILGTFSNLPVWLDIHVTPAPCARKTKAGSSIVGSECMVCKASGSLTKASSLRSLTAIRR